MRAWLAVVACQCACLCTAARAPAAAKTHHHTWNITYQYKSPDCVRKLAVTINGESPGPTIRAAQGDTLVITVHNMLETENTAIHWHGIRQIGSPWADGTAGVTQCPILPGENFTYRFVVDKPGTYMYHAHYGMQRVAGLDGMLVVSVPDGVAEPFVYDEVRTVLLMDWWHKSVYDQAVGLASIPFDFVGEPQSLLINRKGMYNCSSPAANRGGGGACNASSLECGWPTLCTAVAGKTYRLRISSLTSLSSLSFEIEGHTMTVVEADGYFVKPVVVRNLFIYSGETYSVLVKADQDPSRSYWAASHIVSRNPTKTSPGRAVVRYAGGGNNNPYALPPTAPPAGPVWNDTKSRVEQSRSFTALPSYVKPPPARPDRVLILLNTQNKIDDHTKWAINGVSLSFPATPYLVAMKHGLRSEFDQRPPPDSYDLKNVNISSPPPAGATVRHAVYRLALGSVVDLVLQNTMIPSNNRSETHPWHLHGHGFWVLGYGDGKFVPEADGWKLNVRDPVMKNTVALHPMGRTAVRFRANNPGVWLFHCHLEAHVYMGMGVVFEEGVETVARLPASIMGCGRTKGHHS